MKSKLLLVLVLFSVSAVACQTGEGKINTETKIGPSEEGKDTLQQTNVEYMDWEAVKINGKLPLLAKTEELYHLLGQPDSLVTPDMDEQCAGYFVDGYQIAYFGNSNFDVKNNRAIIGSINFEDGNNIQLHWKGLILDHSLTLNKLKDIFPLAFEAREEINIDHSGKATVISIAGSKAITDSAWLLFFRNGKLIRIDSWGPC